MPAVNRYNCTGIKKSKIINE